MKIICLVGMPGAGKGAVGKILEKGKIPIVVMSSVVREEVKKRGRRQLPAQVTARGADFQDPERARPRFCQREDSSVATASSGLELIGEAGCLRHQTVAHGPSLAGAADTAGRIPCSGTRRQAR